MFLHLNNVIHLFFYIETDFHNKNFLEGLFSGMKYPKAVLKCIKSKLSYPSIILLQNIFHILISILYQCIKYQ